MNGTNERVERIKGRFRRLLDAYQDGRISLGALVGDAEALIDLLADEQGDEDWLDALRTEVGALEIVYTRALDSARSVLSPEETRTVGATVACLRSMLAGVPQPA